MKVTITNDDGAVEVYDAVKQEGSGLSGAADMLMSALDQIGKTNPEASSPAAQAQLRVREALHWLNEAMPAESESPADEASSTVPLGG